MNIVLIGGPMSGAGCKPDGIWFHALDQEWHSLRHEYKISRAPALDGDNGPPIYYYAGGVVETRAAQNARKAAEEAFRALRSANDVQAAAYEKWARAAQAVNTQGV